MIFLLAPVIEAQWRHQHRGASSETGWREFVVEVRGQSQGDEANLSLAVAIKLGAVRNI